MQGESQMLRISHIDIAVGDTSNTEGVVNPGGAIGINIMILINWCAKTDIWIRMDICRTL